MNLQALLFATALSLAMAQMNPCHSGKNSYDEEACLEVYFPPTLCANCLLDTANVKPDGNLEDCSAFYTIDAKCLSAFETYVKANPCDKVRAEAVQKFKSIDADEKEEGRVALDYFAYGLCEECCDCIPWGATTEQAQADGVGEIKENRGNCPAHYYYDICNVLSNVGTFGVALLEDTDPQKYLEFLDSRPIPKADADGVVIPETAVVKPEVKAVNATAKADPRIKMKATPVKSGNDTIVGTVTLYDSPVALCGDGSIFDEWFDKHSGGWGKATEIDMTVDVFEALSAVNAALDCSELGAWSACHDMELKQGRV